MLNGGGGLTAQAWHSVNILTGPRSETVETRGGSSRWWGLGYIGLLALRAT